MPKSSFSKSFCPLIRKMRPVGTPRWSKATVIKLFRLNCCCVGLATAARISKCGHRGDPSQIQAGAFKGIPTDGRIHIIEEKIICPCERNAFGTSRSLSPASAAKRKMRSRSASRKIRSASSVRNAVRQFLQKLAQRFGKALIDLHCIGNAERNSFSAA